MNDALLTIFYDGHCPLCRFDIVNLQAWDTQHKLRFIDIHAKDFQPERYGMCFEDFHRCIRARYADGRFISGMAVFRAAYQAVERGWMLAPSGWGIFRRPVDGLYTLFARHRQTLSRCLGWLFAYLAARRARSCQQGWRQLDKPD